MAGSSSDSVNDALTMGPIIAIVFACVISVGLCVALAVAICCTIRKYKK